MDKQQKEERNTERERGSERERAQVSGRVVVRRGIEGRDKKIEKERERERKGPEKEIDE